MRLSLFPFTDFWWFYLAFTVLIVLLLVIDLRGHRNVESASMKAAALWSAVWIALALGFSAVLYVFSSARFGAPAARQVSLEFIAGYLVEESLSVDNMFVFALVFRYFAVPSRYQRRVLFYGVLGAMVFRGVFIAAGAMLMQLHWIVLTFGAFLIFAGVRMALESEKRIDPGANIFVRLARRILPVSAELHGDRFFVRSGAILQFTPLMVVLLVLETTDILFAVDSVPAVFGVTKEPLVVFTSNVFAILGLRSLYFVLAGALDRFHILKYGLAFVLAFVGVKMMWLDQLAGGRFPIGLSLSIIAVAIGASVALSLVFPKTHEKRKQVRRPPVFHKIVGALFLTLCALDVLVVAGPGRALLSLNMEGLRLEWFVSSGICYGLCGWLLLRTSER